MEPTTGASVFNVLMQAVATAGIPSALIVFFVWQGSIRERALIDRIHVVEDFIRDKLIDQNNKTTAALTENSNVMRSTSEAMTACVGELKGIRAELHVHHEMSVAYIAGQQQQKKDS